MLFVIQFFLYGMVGAVLAMAGINPLEKPLVYLAILVPILGIDFVSSIKGK